MTAATAPQREIGYAQNTAHGGYWWTLEDETTPELVWPNSVVVYDSMRRTDSQVASVLRAVTLPVRRTPWRIDPNGARDEVVEHVATDLGLPIVGAEAPKAPPRMRDRFSWPEHLRQALLMLPYGHSYFEMTYRVDKDGSRAHLHKLAPRPAKTIERIEVARDGGLVWIKQYPSGPGGSGDSQKPIPVSSLVAYIHDREGGNWLGTSVLRPAYKNWLLKDRLLRVQAQTIERNGMGIPLYKAQENASESDIAAGRDMATAWRAGEAAGSAIPFGADLVLRGVEGTLPDAEKVVRYHDEQIARAVLAHFLNLGTQTGSWALGTTFADFFTLSLQTLAQQIADTATMHVIEDLVDANWGEDEPAPRLVFDEIGSRQAATAAAIKSLIDAGAIQLDGTLEEMLRQQYGLPPRDPEAAQEDEAAIDADAMVAAIDAFRGGGAQPVAAAAGPNFNRLHPRGAKGRFRDTFSRILDGLTKWAAAGGEGDPFDGFEREPLRRVAVARGITLRRGASRDDVADALLGHLREALAGKPDDDSDDEPEAKPPAKKAVKKAAPRKRTPAKPDPEPRMSDAEVQQIINSTLTDEGKRRILTSNGVPQSEWPEALRPQPVKAAPKPTAAEKLAAGYPDVPPGVDVDEDEWAAMSYSERVDAIVSARPDPEQQARDRQADAPAKKAAPRKAPLTGDAALAAAPIDFTRPESGLTADEAAVFNDYVGDGAYGTNPALRENRGHNAPHDDEMAAEVGLMDAAMARSPLAADVLVERGISYGSAAEVFGGEERWRGDLTGATVLDHGFMSTTARVGGGTQYAEQSEDQFGEQARILIRVPAGTRAIKMSGSEYEDELLLQRGLTLRVISDSGYDENGGRLIEAEVVGKPDAPAMMTGDEFDRMTVRQRRQRMKAMGYTPSLMQVVLSGYSSDAPDLEQQARDRQSDIDSARKGPSNAPRVTALEPGAPAPHDEFGLPRGTTVPASARRLSADQDRRLRLLLEADNSMYNRYLAYRENGRSHSDAVLVVNMPTLAQLERKLGARGRGSDGKARGEDREQQARDRQRDIDSARRYADVAGELDQILHDGGSDTAVLARLDAARKRHGIAEELAPVRAAVERAREIEVENRVRAAYRQIREQLSDRARSRGWVSIADLRDQLGDLPRGEQDAALKNLVGAPGVFLVPEMNQSALTPRDREGGVRIGGETNHYVKFDDPSDRPDARTEMTSLLQAHGVRPYEAAGDKVTFDRKQHESTTRLSDGAQVEVIRPGYTLDRDGESIRLSKATVEAAPELRKLTDVEADNLSTAQFSPDGSVLLRDARQRAKFERDGLIDEQGRITDAGRAALAAHQPSFDATETAQKLFGLKDDDAGLRGALEGLNKAQLRALFVVMRHPEPGSRVVDRPNPFVPPAASQRADAPALRDALFAVFARERSTERGTRLTLVPPSVDPLSDLRSLPDPEAIRDALDLRKIDGSDGLKSLLKSAGLLVSGRKRDLVDRLVEHLGGGTPEATPARPLTAAEARSVRLFTTPQVARRINERLRSGSPLGSMDVAGEGEVSLDQIRDDLDAAIDAGLMPETVAWRGVALSDAEAARYVPGASVVESGYLSVSQDRATAEDFGRRLSGDGGNAYTFEVRVPAGTHAANGSPLVGEWVLARGSTLRVVARDGNRITVEIISGGSPSTPEAPRKRAPAKAVPGKTGRPPATPVPIHELFEADDATIEAALRDVFEGQFGPYTTKVEVGIRRAGTRTDSRGRVTPVDPQIWVEGKIYNAEGHEIGNFGRSVGPTNLHYGDVVRREMWATHGIVQIDDKFQGKGFGAAFTRRVVDWYRASGVHGISQDDHNFYVWASQGFNFRGGIVSRQATEAMQDLIADLRAGKTKNKYGETIPKALRDAPDIEVQIAAAEELLARMETSRPGQPDYPTAYEISQLGRRPGQRGKTALWFGKQIPVSADELILNPDEGEVITG